MDKIEYRAAQAHLKLNEAGMAKLLGVSRRCASGYANGGPIPGTVAVLLKLIVVMHLAPEDVPKAY
jgi:predicted transcriptional regulator